MEYNSIIIRIEDLHNHLPLRCEPLEDKMSINSDVLLKFKISLFQQIVLKFVLSNSDLTIKLLNYRLIGVQNSQCFRSINKIIKLSNDQRTKYPFLAFTVATYLLKAN